MNKLIMFAASIKDQTGKAVESANTPTTVVGVVGMVLNVVYIAVAVVAVIFIIMGGINYATSQGDPNKIKKAKDTLLYAVIGLIAAFLAFAITTFVLDKIQGK